MAHHAEQVGRPEDGSSREKAEAPAEVAAGAASVEVAAEAETRKKTFLAPWQRKWLPAWHQRKGPLVQVKKGPAEVVAGAPSVEVAADISCRKVKTQRQMASQMTSSVWHLLTQWRRRVQSDARKYAD